MTFPWIHEAEMHAARAGAALAVVVLAAIAANRRAIGHAKSP